MVAKTLYPALANARAVSRPIPLLVPVIMTDFIFLNFICDEFYYLFTQ
jgi:hypothetical protein